jgi:hypothetical protein
VAAAAVRFAASHAGALTLEADPTSADPTTLTATTSADGVAQVRWRLDPTGPTTQTLATQRLDDHGQPVDVPVVVTGRLSVARQVAWDPLDCPRFAGTRTVQEALATLVANRELRLLGGDGQSVTAVGEVVQRPVRVVVEDGCGPVAGATVIAHAGSDVTGSGLVMGAREGDLAPATLEGIGTDRATVRTGEDGVAAFWWQPSFGDVRWSTLDIRLEGSDTAPVRVTANLDVGGQVGRTDGLHITGLRFDSGARFDNDDIVPVDALASGIIVELDGTVDAASVNPSESATGPLPKPVIRVELELPWPVGPERDVWNTRPVGTQAVTLNAMLRPEGDRIRWIPEQLQVRTWLLGRLFPALAQLDITRVLGRYVLDGWALVGQDNPRLHVNTHARTRIEPESEPRRTVFRLPTDDEVTGGQFVQWFHLVPPPVPQ